MHVWRIDTTAAAEHLARTLDAESILSDAELARGGLISGEQRGARWLAAHVVLRLLIGRYLDRPPGELQFAIGERGKPSLVQDAELAEPGPRAAQNAAVKVHFNLSHSAHAALCAFSALAPLGIDVEVARRERDYTAIARRVFGDAEAARLCRLDLASREREFLRAWSRREAELKCRGTGFGCPRAADIAGERDALWVAELDLGPRAAGAVASSRRPKTLRCWSWEMAQLG